MGVVYRARDSMLGRQVALKQLFPELLHNRELASRFHREAQVLARLRHPHVVQVFDLAIDDAGMWMAMEWLRGGSLADRLRAEGALPFAEVRRLGLQMAAALAHAHAEGVVHRDFKPDNVMLTREGDVKVTDFGLAGLGELEGDAKLTRPGTMMGSPAYMSPEQISGDPVDARADVYAMGVTLYEMASGRTPFEGSTTAVLTQHLSVQPELPPPGAGALPAAFVALLEGMLQKPRAARVGSMAEVITALDGCAA
jgi:serine/threonine-protein kinase